MMRNHLLTRLMHYEWSLKPLKKYLSESYLDAERNAVILLNGEAVTNWYHPLSMAQQLEIDPAIFEYIDTKAYPIPVQYPLNIELHNCKLSPDEQATISRLIREHYTLILHDKKLDLRTNMIRVLLLFLFGAAFLVFSFWLSTLHTEQFVIEFCSIVATFSLWEAVDLFLLESRRIKVEHLNAGQLAKASVIFVD